MSFSTPQADRYDVAIVGGGPAGLSLAAILAKHFGVALLERSRVLATRKAWCILELEGFRAEEEFVLNRMTKGTIRLRDQRGAHDFTNPMNPGEACVLVDENRVVAKWVDLARQNGCRLLEETDFLDFEYLEDGVRLRTTSGDLEARLLVDASGYGSPILKKLGLDARTDFLVPTYGGYIRKASFRDTTNALGLVMDASTDLCGEYFPISEDRGCAWVFRILPNAEFARRPEKNWIDELRGQFRSTLARDPEVCGSELEVERFGVIPMKKGQQKAVNRILLVGDAGGSTPYSMLGFNRIYKNHPSVARQIAERLEANLLDRKSLGGITFNGGNRFSDAVGPLLIQTLTRLTFDDVLRITRKIRAYDLFGEFVDLQAHAADNSVRLEHVQAFGRKLMKRPLAERLDTIRESFKFISARDLGLVARAMFRESRRGRKP